jgi:hypothetical protein
MLLTMNVGVFVILNPTLFVTVAIVLYKMVISKNDDKRELVRLIATEASNQVSPVMVHKYITTCYLAHDFVCLGSDR